MKFKPGHPDLELVTPWRCLVRNIAYSLTALIYSAAFSLKNGRSLHRASVRCRRSWQYSISVARNESQGPRSDAIS